MDHERLDDLVCRYFDAALSADEERELAAALAASADHRARFAAYMRMEGAARHLSKAGAETTALETKVIKSAPNLFERGRLARRGWITKAIGAAACIAVVALVWMLYQRSSSPIAFAAIECSGDAGTVARGEETFRAAPGVMLFSGDKLTCSRKLLVRFSNEATWIEAAAGTQIAFNAGDMKTIDLAQGTVLATVAPQRAGQMFVFRTPQAQAEVIGTRFKLAAGSDATRLEVSEGRVRLRQTSGEQVLVGAGYFADAKSGTTLVAQALVPKMPKKTAFPPIAPPLPDPTGTIIAVSNEKDLQQALQKLASNTTIMIAPGTYDLQQTLRINATAQNVTLRGATGKAEDVRLRGKGAEAGLAGAPVGIDVAGARDVLIADLSMSDFGQHAIVLESGCRNVRCYNLRLSDVGEQILVSRVNEVGVGVTGIAVEYCRFEFSKASRSVHSAVAIVGGDKWIVRRNVFHNIGTHTRQLSGPALFVFGGSSDITCDSNVFTECDRSISFGLFAQGEKVENTGGIIRNNFVYRSPHLQGDVGIMVADSPGTKVLHNTVISSGTFLNCIEYRFPRTKGVIIAGNLTDGPIAKRDDAEATDESNFQEAQPEMFLNASHGDLHLRAGTSPIDKMPVRDDCAEDFDGDQRPLGTLLDVGADEADPAADTN